MRTNESVENALTNSALATNGIFHSIEEFIEWFHSRRKANRFIVEEIDFAQMNEWYFAEDPYRLAHVSGKFFTIEGIRVKTNYGAVRQWDQPIINQPEIGILGIIIKEFEGVYHFLMQAKMEPGNTNIIQLSPTVQATRSNFTQVHKGKLPPYLEYFIDGTKSNILIDQLQSEQGGRFMAKRNRNMIVEVKEDLTPADDFYWLTLGQLKRLLAMDNLVNMDARTVISCIPLLGSRLRSDTSFKQSGGSAHINISGRRISGFQRDLFLSTSKSSYSLHTGNRIISWFSEMRSRYDLAVERIPLNEVKSWIHTDRDIQHISGKYFSVIAVSVLADSREVPKWDQPLLKHTGYGMVGFLSKKIAGTLHFLVHACPEPGNRDVIQMGPTVAYSSWIGEVMDKADLPYFVDLFLELRDDQIRYSAVQSEEGGRFYDFQNRYIVLELPLDKELDLPDGYIWMTLGQITDFSKHGYFNIEARNLISCLDVFGEL